jgi:hypothetical protein
VGKIGYKNGLQVSVGHLRVPGAELLILYSIVEDCFVNTLKTNDI